MWCFHINTPPSPQSQSKKKQAIVDTQKNHTRSLNWTTDRRGQDDLSGNSGAGVGLNRRRERQLDKDQIVKWPETRQRWVSKLNRNEKSANRKTWPEEVMLDLTLLPLLCDQHCLLSLHNNASWPTSKGHCCIVAVRFTKQDQKAKFWIHPRCFVFCFYTRFLVR